MPDIVQVPRRALALARTYALPRLTGARSTNSFWALPEPARVRGPADLARYLTPEGGAPPYLMDYRAKLAHDLFDARGVPVLPYEAPIGLQVNPEAAFQYALGVHDEHAGTGSEAARARFLALAETMLQDQTPEGDWEYRFDWFESKAPWSSALAQSRGASVMLRAWMHTDDAHYLEAARAAFSKFDVPAAEGGYLSALPANGARYYEEYPKAPNCVFNGAMAALFGLWEAKTWAQDEHAAALWSEGVEDFERMLPLMTTSWWTVYDLDPRSPVENVHSPRYHRLVVSYLEVLQAIHPRPAFDHYLRAWRAQDHALARARAIGQKAIRKVLYK